jgi:hypothetical protein
MCAVLLSMNELRIGARKRILKTGRIEFGAEAIECVVRSISVSGALVEVESCLGIPTEFNLVMTTDRTRHQAYVVWRKEKKLGVSFRPESAL